MPAAARALPGLVLLLAGASAQAAGTGDAAGQLSQVLPQLIDHLTPHGQAPEGGLGDVGDLLGALLRR